MSSQLIQRAADGRTRTIEFRGTDDGKIGMLITFQAKDGKSEFSTDTAYLFTEEEFSQLRDMVIAIATPIEERNERYALRSALQQLLTATQPQHTLAHVFLGEAQERARAVLCAPNREDREEAAREEMRLDNRSDEEPA